MFNNQNKKIMSEVKEVKTELSPRAIKASQGLNKRGLNPKQAREAKALKRQVKEFARANGLDWGVIKKPTYFDWDGERRDTGNFSLVHTKSEESLNTVKDGYRVSQNLHIIQLMLMGVRGFDGKLKVVKAGELNGGRRVFIQIEITGKSYVKGDEIKKYITIVDSNDGSASLSVGIGNLTVSCMNQFFYFSKNSNVKFRHSASMAEKMKTIPSLIEEALSRSIKMMNLYNDFESTPCTRELAHAMVRNQLGYNLNSNPEDLAELSAKSLKTMNSLYDNIYGEMDGDDGNGNVAKGENLWGLFSGVTRWTTHHKQAPRRGDKKDKTNASGRLESVMVGTNYKNNLKALNFVLDEAGLKF